jgi:hypothetical protein
VPLQLQGTHVTPFTHAVRTAGVTSRTFTSRVTHSRRVNDLSGYVVKPAPRAGLHNSPSVLCLNMAIFRVRRVLLRTSRSLPGPGGTGVSATSSVNSQAREELMIKFVRKVCYTTLHAAVLRWPVLMDALSQWITWIHGITLLHPCHWPKGSWCSVLAGNA